MTAYVVLNGEITKNIIDYIPKEGNIYCADGGANHLYKYGLVPKIIMGDMDSINPEVKVFYENKKCDFVTFPCEKDETDGELIVNRALSDDPDEIVILCGLGGRIDHLLGNIQLLYRIVKSGIIGKIIDENTELIMSLSMIKIKKTNNQIISVIPYLDDTVLSLNGFKYNVERFKFDKGKPIGLSNYLVEETGIINIHKGCPLVIITKNAM